MNDQMPTCPCGYPDFRIEVDLSALIAINPDDVTLEIEGYGTHARVGDVYCVNCESRTVAQHRPDEAPDVNHREAVRRAIEALEVLDATVNLSR